MKYAIYTRYEYFGKNGMTFTNWFKLDYMYDTEAEANDAIKINKTKYKESDKIAKRKHEFEIRYIDETLLPLPTFRRAKGRPKKIKNEELDNILKSLYKSKKKEVIIDPISAPIIYNDNTYRKYISDAVDKKYKGEYWAHFWYDYSGDKTAYIMLKHKDFKLL